MGYFDVWVILMYGLFWCMGYSDVCIIL